jgi:hypothetical protein
VAIAHTAVRATPVAFAVFASPAPAAFYLQPFLVHGRKPAVFVRLKNIVMKIDYASSHRSLCMFLILSSRAEFVAPLKSSGHVIMEASKFFGERQHVLKIILDMILK